MLFPSQGTRAPRYLHTTCLSCASLLLCALSVWGWLVHDTLLKIDIRSLCKRRLTKKWEGMKAHKGARECDRDRGRQRGEGGGKKESQGGRKKILPMRQTRSQRKQIHASLKWRWKKGGMNISGEGNETEFQECKWGQMHAAEMWHI